MQHEHGEEEIAPEDEYVEIETHDDDGPSLAEGERSDVPKGSKVDLADTLPQVDDEVELKSEDEKGAHKVGKGDWNVIKCLHLQSNTIVLDAVHVLFIKSIRSSCHISVVGQDQQPLFAVPDQEEHMERRAEALSKQLEVDGHNDDRLQAHMLT